MSSSMIATALFLAAAPANIPPAVDTGVSAIYPLSNAAIVDQSNDILQQPDAPIVLPQTVETPAPAVSVAPAKEPAASNSIVAEPTPLTAEPDLPQNPGTTGEALEEAPTGDEEPAIVVNARQSVPEDPLAKINAQTYAVVQSVDQAIIGPVATAYIKNVPSPARSGIRNFFNNLREPLVAVNFLLQLKPGKAAETVGRFVINTTAGVAGLFDVAKKKPINLPRRSNGFADTMGYYGIKQGAFLFLPILGPTTIRDAIGGGLDGLFLPATVGKPFNRLTYTLPTGLLSSLGERADFDDQLKKIREESNDPYTAAREYYLTHRQAEIDVLRGRRANVDSPLYESISADPKADTIKATSADSAQEHKTELTIPPVESAPSDKAMPHP
jgi:phospholipid-binding lipoprotein MlaA